MVKKLFPPLLSINSLFAYDRASFLSAVDDICHSICSAIDLTFTAVFYFRVILNNISSLPQYLF